MGDGDICEDRMSDDLVKRLRWLGDHASFEPHMHHTAADRIEKDAAHIDEMYELVAAMNADHAASKTRIKKLEAALEKISRERTLWGAMRKADHALGKFEDKALEGKDE
jgi:hypothetical protein